LKIVYVVNEASFFLSHRLPLAIEARRRGFDVIVACGAGTGEARLSAAGIECRPFPLSRSGGNPLEETASFRALWRIFREERPDLVHHVTIKPVIYGTPAARWSGVPAVVNAVPGMGFVFTRRGLGARLRRQLVRFMYRIALVHPNMHVIFQNADDMQSFIDARVVDRSRTTLIRGSGVDLGEFAPGPEPPGAVTFLLVGRMIRHKGVVEYVEAARVARESYPDWRFLLVGDVDPGNPASLTPDELLDWVAEGTVEWLGRRSDVARLIASAHVVVLPSYREGLPKTLLEAAACGRAMIATDIAGCREVVRHGVTGLLVPPRTHEELASAMITLGTRPELRQRFGRAAREKAEAVFSIEDVVRHTFLVYERLLAT
jgi:glycosyltransferase involved in cell wall biosynthesis